MLSIGLGMSVPSSFRLLERRVKMQVKSIQQMMQGAAITLHPAAEIVTEKAIATKEAPCLRIATTVLPATKLDFNTTFQHLRLELDQLYKAENPIFDNSATLELWNSTSAFTQVPAGLSTPTPLLYPKSSTPAYPERSVEELLQPAALGKDISEKMYAQAYSFSLDADILTRNETVTKVAPVLRIAKTTMPDVRLDFNQTFQHLRLELDKMYKQENPIFDNSATTELWANATPTATQSQHIGTSLPTTTAPVSVQETPVALAPAAAEPKENTKSVATTKANRRPSFPPLRHGVNISRELQNYLHKVVAELEALTAKEAAANNAPAAMRAPMARSTSHQHLQLEHN